MAQLYACKADDAVEQAAGRCCGGPRSACQAEPSPCPRKQPEPGRRAGPETGSEINAEEIRIGGAKTPAFPTQIGKLRAPFRNCPETPRPRNPRYTRTARAAAVEDTGTWRRRSGSLPSLMDKLVNYAGEVSIYRSRLEQQIGAVRHNLKDVDSTVQRLKEQLRKMDIESGSANDVPIPESASTQDGLTSSTRWNWTVSPTCSSCRAD